MEGIPLSIGLIKRNNQTRISIYNHADFPIWLLIKIKLANEKGKDITPGLGVLFSGIQNFPVFPKQGFEFPIKELDIKGKKSVMAHLIYQAMGAQMQGELYFNYRPDLKEWHLRYIGMPYKPPYSVIELPKKTEIKKKKLKKK